MTLTPPILPTSLRDARVTVMGLGLFGGGVGVTRWLCEQDACVTVTDLCSERDLTDSLAELSDLPAHRTTKLHLGQHLESDFTRADLIVVNPAVPHPWANPLLIAAQDAGVALTTEIRLLVERLDRSHVVGVTGSAGKSTTAAMIHHILTERGIASHLGGNIGGSLLSSLEQITPDDVIVLELSSAMLHWLGEDVGYRGARGWSPHVAVQTNIQPNHIDWHDSFEHYQHSKQNIFAYQQPGDYQIRGSDFKQRRELPLAIPGKHNQLNGMLALTAALRIANIPPPDSVAALSSFRGLPHRLQRIATRCQQQFYDDSKATLPEATILAVESFAKPSKVHLIVGGYDKKLDLTPLARLAGKVAGLYAIGTTGPGIVALAADERAITCSTLDVAVPLAMQAMGPDDILLLSPGCASWDQFENFEQRGRAFATLVEQQPGVSSGL